jgi:hypothetical protein
VSSPIGAFCALRGPDVAGRRASPLPPRPFTVSGAIPEVFRPVRAAAAIAGRGVTTPVVFVPVQRPGSARIDPPLARSRRSSSPGLPRPSIDVSGRCPLPPRSARADARSESSASATEAPLRRPVPSSWLLATSTVCSTCWSAGLLHPAADPGVRRVPPARRLVIGPGEGSDPVSADGLPATRPAPRRSSLDPSRPASPRASCPLGVCADARASAATFEALLRSPGL